MNVKVNAKEVRECEGKAPAAYFAKARKAKERGPTELGIYDYNYEIFGFFDQGPVGTQALGEGELVEGLGLGAGG